MTEVYRFSQSEIVFFALVMLRLSAFVVSWPVFGVENISAQLKVLFALILTMVLFPTLKISPAQVEAMNSNLVLLAIREVFVGLSIGFLGRLFFDSFRIAGEMLSQAMGLSSAQIFNPTLGGQSTSLEQFYVVLASLFYLTINGHHFLIAGLVKAFEWVPVATLSLNTAHFASITQMVQEVFVLGLKFSAPVVISILVTNLVLGVVGKTVPQLNVLITSFPINILLGFFLLIITMPILFDQMGDFLRVSTDHVFRFIKAY